MPQASPVYLVVCDESSNVQVRNKLKVTRSISAHSHPFKFPLRTRALMGATDPNVVGIPRSRVRLNVTPLSSDARITPSTRDVFEFGPEKYLSDEACRLDE